MIILWKCRVFTRLITAVFSLCRILENMNSIKPLQRDRYKAFYHNYPLKCRRQLVMTQPLILSRPNITFNKLPLFLFSYCPSQTSDTSKTYDWTGSMGASVICSGGGMAGLTQLLCFLVSMGMSLLGEMLLNCTVFSAGENSLSESALH